MSRIARFAALSLAASLPVLALTACAEKEYHYWQKTDPTTAIYLTGPKAQQMLEEDISGCVHEIIELDKLQTIRSNISHKASTLDDNYSQKAEAERLSQLPGYDVPEYIRSLRVEHKNFQDFDGCMRYNGWARVKYVSPETEARSRAIYERPADYETRPETKATDEEPSDAMQREEESLKRR